MALNDEKKRKPVTLAQTGSTDPAGALPAVGRWALYGGAEPAAPKPMFSAPDYTKPNPTNAPIMVPSTAPAKPGALATVAKQAPQGPAPIPKPSFTNVTGKVTTSYGQPADQAPRPAGTQGAGAPSAGGPGSALLRAGDPNTFTGVNGVTRAVSAAQPGSVNTQSFGNPVSTLRNAASTFGQSVRTMPDDNVVSMPRPNVAVRGPDAMAEQYNSREDREAQRKLLSDLESQRFATSLYADNGGKAGRAALEAMGDIDRQRVAIANGMAGQSGEAVQNREQRSNVLANTGLEQAGALDRANLDAQVTREGNALDYQQGMANIAAEISRPETVTDASGRLLLRQGATTQAITGPDGQPVTVAQKADTSGQITPQDQYKAISDQIVALQKTPPMMGAAPEELAAYTQQMSTLQAQREALLGGGKSAQGAVTVKSAADLAKLPRGAAYIAPDGKTYTKN